MEKLYQEMLKEQKVSIAKRRSANMIHNQISDYYISNINESQRKVSMLRRNTANYLVKGVSEALDIAQYYVNKRMTEEQRRVADSPELKVKVAKSQAISDGIFQQYITKNISPNVNDVKSDDDINKNIHELFAAVRAETNDYVTKENIIGLEREALIAKNEAYLGNLAKSYVALEYEKKSAHEIGNTLSGVMQEYSDSENQNKADLISKFDSTIKRLQSKPLLFAQATEIGQDLKFEIMLSDANSIEEATAILQNIAVGNYKWDKYSDNVFDQLTPEQKAENSKAAQDILSGEKSDAKIASLYGRAQLFGHDNQVEEGSDYATRKIIELERKEELKESGQSETDEPLVEAKYDYFENDTPNNINSNDAALQELDIPTNIDITKPENLSLHISSVDAANQKYGSNFNYLTKPIIFQFIELLKEREFAKVLQASIQLVKATGERSQSFRISSRDSLSGMRDSMRQYIKEYSGDDENAFYGMIGLLNIIETHLQDDFSGTSSYLAFSEKGGRAYLEDRVVDKRKVGLEDTKKSIDNLLSVVKNNTAENIYTDEEEREMRRGFEIAKSNIDDANAMEGNLLNENKIKVLLTLMHASNDGKGTSNASDIQEMIKIYFPERLVHSEFIPNPELVFEYLNGQDGIIIDVDSYLKKHPNNSLTAKEIKKLRVQSEEYKKIIKEIYYSGSKKFILSRKGNNRKNVYLMYGDGTTAELSGDNISENLKGLYE